MAFLGFLACSGLVGALAPARAAPSEYAAGTRPISQEEYRQDFDFLVEQLEARHPDPFAVTSKAAFVARLNALIDKVDEQDSFTNMMDLRVIVASLGDSHTSVGFYDAIFERGAFPMEFAWFGEDLRIIGAEKEFSEFLGARLDAINAHDIKAVRDELATLVPPQDTGFARKRVPWMMRHIGLHHYIGTAKGSSAVWTLTTLSGQRVTVTIPASVLGDEEADLIYLSDQIDHPTWINSNEDRLDVMFRDILYPDGVYLVQYNSAWGRELQERFRDPATAKDYPLFSEFSDRIIGTLKDKDVKAMIFDVRANSGGSSPQGTRLAEEIAALPDEHQPGSVYVAVGDQTFSAAIINAMNFNQTLGAQFIGTTSGGKANHFGEVRMFILPNSGIELPHSTRYFEYVEGEGGSIVPDIYSPESIDDMLAGRDAVVESVRKQVAQR
ncbi:MAG: hypothetical protein AAF692_05475 [Pseudomonadota bacterium]